MNTHQLLLFRYVAEELNLSRASEKLGISQPAISKQLQMLERSLGAPLLNRHAQGVSLTEAGTLLAGYARRMAVLVDDAQRAVDELQGLKRGKLVIGASTTIGIYYLPEKLAYFRKQYPAVEIDLRVANTHEIQQQLTEHRVDVGLTEGFVHWPELHARAFYKDELVAIVPAGHELTRQRAVPLHVFCSQPLLMREVGSGTREVIEQVLARKRVRVQPLMTLGHTEAIKQSVAAGVGVAFVSRLTIQNELLAGRLAVVPILNFSLMRALHIVQASDRQPSAAVRAFLALLPADAERSGS